MRRLHLNFLSNKRTIRFLQILAYFEGNPESTLRELAEMSGFKDRTILLDIKNMRDYFAPSIEITAAHTGYHFKILDAKSYTALKNQLVMHEPLFIIMESILLGNLRSYEEWGEEFYFSESTMKRQLIRVANTLKEYDLTFSYSPVDLVGEEVNIRKFLKDFYYEADDLAPFTLEPSIEMSELINHIKANRYHPSVGTDILPTDFYYQFYIMIQRSRHKKYLPVTVPSEIDWQNDAAYRFFLSLKPKIFARYGFDIPDKELLVLYLYSICKRTIDFPSKEQIFCQKFNVWPEIKIEAQNYLIEYDPLLADPAYPASTLIESFLTSIKYLDQLAPIMNKNITEVNRYAQNTYPERYEKTHLFLKTKARKIGIHSRYLADIAASLVLTIEAVRDTYVSNPKRIAFLFEGSSYISRSMKAKAIRYLNGYHTLYFPTIEQMDQDFFIDREIEIFVTNHAEYISYLTIDMDYVLFQSIPDMDDWNHLLRTINPQISQDFFVCH
ncbi:helix-turn-helix domain-containing protein [Enterococcus gallinarum]|uniref:helix-turn-helix domain-containing protein n=1 Tax=Enterococcus gallinarum TaxID=1353 RepID=UPI0024338D51|nr:helix-turn-helix domain-containing protein [Enterococcus gallinarum]